MSAQLRLTSLLFLLTAALWISASTVHAESGIVLDIIVHEILASDPPESAVIDSVSYPVGLGRTTTLRAGNFVVDVTVQPGENGSVELRASLFVTGPLPDNRSDEAEVAPGAALMIDGIRGKGKSSYRARLIPRLAEVASGTSIDLGDTAQWQFAYSARAQYFVPNGILPPLQFIPLRGTLDYEFEGTLDTLKIDPPGRLLVYLSPGELSDWPVEPEYGYAIDPSRYRVVAVHDPLSPRIRPRALVLAACYRAWGYAPALLASGVVGYPEFADYEVLEDRRAGRSIPLDSLANTMDYKRCDRRVADHHAESFVAWLVSAYGLPHFRDLYDRATDLSIHRAFWSVYGRTLAELEKQWLEHLKNRRIYREEFVYYANREMAFHNFESLLTLLKKADSAVSPPTEEILRSIGIAQAQLGRWDDAARAFGRLLSEYPDAKGGHWYQAEAQRAAGDDIAAWRSYTEMLRRDTADAQAYLRLGDMQWDIRRVDSAASLWRKGQSANPGRFAGAELHLRFGHYFSERRGGLDSSRTHFSSARNALSQTLANDPTNVSAWIITGEALLGLDSASLALDHLSLAQALSNAPVDVGRVRLLRGQCFDRLGRRKEAVAEYETALSGRPEAHVARLAGKYLNRPYGG